MQIFPPITELLGSRKHDLSLPAHHDAVPIGINAAFLIALAYERQARPQERGVIRRRVARS